MPWRGGSGPPDLLLLSCDLASRGAAEEYKRADRLLDALLGWLRDALLGWLREETGGPDPLVVAVPLDRSGPGAPALTIGVALPKLVHGDRRCRR